MLHNAAFNATPTQHQRNPTQHKRTGIMQKRSATQQKRSATQHKRNTRKGNMYISEITKTSKGPSRGRFVFVFFALCYVIKTTLELRVAAQEHYDVAFKLRYAAFFVALV
jgi:hypothetical protein